MTCCTAPCPPVRLKRSSRFKWTDVMERHRTSSRRPQKPGEAADCGQDRSPLGTSSLARLMASVTASGLESPRTKAEPAR